MRKAYREWSRTYFTELRGSIILDTPYIRRVRLLRGKEEIIIFRYTIKKDYRLVEHVTMLVRRGFLKDAASVKPRSSHL